LERPKAVATSAIQGRKEGQAVEGTIDYGRLDVIEALPLSRFYPEGGERLFRAMAGAEIIRIGSTDEDGIEGGGLILDYRRSGFDTVNRVIFAFNESGLWVEREGALDQASPA
jgi:hypothetical protein